MDNDIWIEKALNNRLNSKENRVFEEKLNSDEEFRKEYEWQIQLKSMIGNQKRVEIKNSLRKHEADKISFKKKIWLAAAAVLILVSSATIFLLKTNKPEQDYFLANYSKLPNLIAPNTRSQIQKENLLQEAFQAYNKGDFTKAKVLFEKSVEVEPKSALYSAVCSIELGDYQLAIEDLKSQSYSDDFEYHKNWYLALVYLKTNESKMALEHLNFLVSTQNPWRKSATDLLLFLQK